MSGNGVDLAAVYQLLNIVASDVLKLHRDFGELRQELAGKANKSDVDGLRADVERLRHDVVGFRSEVADYHASVVGHGILISELDDRQRRVEQHLGFSPSS